MSKMFHDSLKTSANFREKILIINLQLTIVSFITVKLFRCKRPSHHSVIGIQLIIDFIYIAAIAFKLFSLNLVNSVNVLDSGLISIILS